MPFVRSVFDVPNINGDFGAIAFVYNYTVGDHIVKGAFDQRVDHRNTSSDAGENLGSCFYNFNASKSNTTYSGTTVRPSAISVLVLLRL